MMKEQYEFRVLEKYAPILFSDHQGTRRGLARNIKINADDPRMLMLGELNKTIRAETSDLFFYSWSVTRRYSHIEMESAGLFQLIIMPSGYFEPAGEECGTIYDQSTACPRCSSGAVQASPLILDLSRIPKGKDISQTIAGEVVISSKLANLLVDNGVSGMHIDSVYGHKSLDTETQDWFQLRVGNSSAEIVSPTRVGINPFDDDDDGKYRCPVCDVIGLNLISEVTIDSSGLNRTDFMESRSLIGIHKGFLRPRRVMMISSRVNNIMAREGIKGFKIEIVHLTH